jgi:hypothetical protein
MLQSINTYFPNLTTGAGNTISALRMISMVPTTMFKLIRSDTSGERSCISRPCNISNVDNERGGRGTFHHYCMPNRRHQSYVSVNIEAKSSSRVRTVGSTATVGAASASAASAGSSIVVWFTNGAGSAAMAGAARSGTVGGSVDFSPIIALVAK